MKFRSKFLDKVLQRVQAPLAAHPSSSNSKHSSAEELVARIGPWMDELREDLLTPEGRYLREFYVMRHSQMRISDSQPHLTYYEEAYPEIHTHLQELEKAGLVAEGMRLSHDVRIYRISQQLFNILINR